MGQTSYPPNAILVTSAGLIGATAAGGCVTLTAAQARTLLSVSSTAEIAAAYQPLDATLTALAGVTTAADKVIYATGADAFAAADLTTFGRSLIDDADAAAARTTLGLGTMATQASTSYALLSGAIFTGNVTLGSFPSGPTLRPLNIKIDGTGVGFVVANSASEYTEFISGGVFKGFRGIGSVPLIVSSEQVRIMSSNAIKCRTTADDADQDFSAKAATFTGLVSLGPYTFATLPSASANSGKCLRITDRGQKQAYSDGTNWLFVHDNSVVA